MLLLLLLATFSQALLITHLTPIFTCNFQKTCNLTTDPALESYFYADDYIAKRAVFHNVTHFNTTAFLPVPYDSGYIFPLIQIQPGSCTGLDNKNLSSCSTDFLSCSDTIQPTHSWLAIRPKLISSVSEITSNCQVVLPERSYLLRLIAYPDNKPIVAVINEKGIITSSFSRFYVNYTPRYYPIDLTKATNP